jgi:hypothetical protein
VDYRLSVSTVTPDLETSSALHVEGLAAAMDGLMSSHDQRARMRLRAPDVLLRFGLEQILQKWTDLFHKVGCT